MTSALTSTCSDNHSVPLSYDPLEPVINYAPPSYPGDVDRAACDDDVAARHGVKHPTDPFKGFKLPGPPTAGAIPLDVYVSLGAYP